MTNYDIWLLNKADEGYILTTPDGVAVPIESLDTLEMLGQMFLDEIEAIEEIEP